MERFHNRGIAMSKKGCINCGSRDTGQKEVAMTGPDYQKYSMFNTTRLSLSSVKNAGIPSFIIRNHPLHPIF